MKPTIHRLGGTRPAFSFGITGLTALVPKGVDYPRTTAGLKFKRFQRQLGLPPRDSRTYGATGSVATLVVCTTGRDNIYPGPRNHDALKQAQHHESDDIGTSMTMVPRTLRGFKHREQPKRCALSTMRCSAHQFGDAIRQFNFLRSL